MANIPLQSISFPGLSDKYTTPTVDATLTQTGAAADAKKTGDEIAGLKNDLSEFPNGNYPQMGAGYANQLVSGLKKEDQTPYNFRRIPYDATLEELKKIVGGTIVNNQLVTNGNFDGASGWSANPTFGTMAVANNKATLTITNQNGSAAITRNNVFITSNHVYVCFATFTSSEDTRSCRFGFANDTATPTRFFEPLAAGVRKSVATIIKPTSVSNSGSFYIYPKLADNGLAVGATFEIENVMAFDATLMLGSALADYAYNIDMSTAGAGVAWLKKHFPAQFDAGYQAYDAGTLKSIEGLTAHTTVADGITHTYALDSDVVLRGIPKLDSNNRLYYDGDEYLPDGTINRKWGERAYQSDDASDGSTMITDGTKTVYKLTTPTTETADPYTTPQIISPDGTEEYVYEDGAFELPVGHSSEYPVDVSGQLDDILDTPSANGTYTLKATVTDGAVTYSWVADA